MDISTLTVQDKQALVAALMPDISREMIRQEEIARERKKANATAVKRVMNALGPRLLKLCWVETNGHACCDGTTWEGIYPQDSTYQIKQAISMLFKVAHKVKSNKEIPAEKEEDLMDFAAAILRLVEARRQE